MTCEVTLEYFPAENKILVELENIGQTLKWSWMSQSGQDDLH